MGAAMPFPAFSDAVDAAISNGLSLTVIAWALLIAHIALGALALWRRKILRALPALNLALAAVVLLYNVSRWIAYPGAWSGAFHGSLEDYVVVFEALVAVAAILGLIGTRVAVYVSAAAFFIHLLAIAGGMYFVFTFRLERLS